MKAQELISRLSDLEVNVGNTERLLSVLSGSVLLYDALVKKPKNLPGALLAGFMIFRGTSGHCFGYALLKNKPKVEKSKNILIKTQIIIDKPVSAVYDFWRNFENLPLFMKHLESVYVLDDETSEWRMKIPGNLGTIPWKAAIIKDEKDKEIRWRSFSDALIHNIGSVQFFDNGDGRTRLYVIIAYYLPFGTIGETIGKVLAPILENTIEEDIKRCKLHFESGLA